jgi:putative transposase
VNCPRRNTTWVVRIDTWTWHRDFTAAAPNVRWCGDITEIPTDEGKLYFASVLDLHSRGLLASATSDHPDADLACDAIKMAAAVRGGRAAIVG